MSLDGLVKVLVHKSLWPEYFRIFVLRSVHVNTPAIPDDIGSRWNVVSFERVILN